MRLIKFIGTILFLSASVVSLGQNHSEPSVNKPSDSVIQPNSAQKTSIKALPDINDGTLYFHKILDYVLTDTKGNLVLRGHDDHVNMASLDHGAYLLILKDENMWILKE